MATTEQGQVDRIDSAGKSIWYYVLLFFCPSAILIVTVLSYNHYSDISRAKASNSNVEYQHLLTLSQSMGKQLFTPLVNDLMVLADDPRVEALANDPSSVNLQALSELLLNFALHKPIFDQVRFIDARGQEQVRVNRRGEQVTLVPPDQLQNKAGRYYFEKTLRLNPKQVYVSPFDLNVEHGKVERPLKPMIRIGTPVLDRTGKKQGLILFNYLGQAIFDLLSDDLSNRRQLYLINEEGYWLLGPSPGQEWSFMFPGRADHRFENKFPDSWPAASDQLDTQQFMGRGLVTTRIVKPFFQTDLAQVITEQNWVLVSFLPTSRLMQIPRDNLSRRLMAGSMLLLLAMIVSWLLGRVFIQRAQVVRNLKAADQRKQELIRQLQVTQAQLLQSEKLAGIGQLAAGVAHEINNPMGYIRANLNSLKDYSAKLLQLLNRYEVTLKELEVQQTALDSLKQYKEEIDFEHLRDDLLDLISESKEGSDRVLKIAADLKAFSHPGETKMHPANLEACIDSTLNVVWNELKYKCTLKKEYSGIPEIVCSSSQLNQVFLNILVNASQAIREKGVITISTDCVADTVIIRIADNGDGIAPENLPHIFEPFFTTKPVGEGTGLGLAISYGIVKKHHGQLTVESKLGSGTTFTIKLPIEQMQEPDVSSPESERDIKKPNCA